MTLYTREELRAIALGEPEQLVVRPSVDEVLIGTAELWAQRSTCPRLAVGAVLALDGHPIAIGYNGAPRGMAHCEHPLDEPCPVSVHAEANALADAARRGARVEGASLYCTHAPCRACAGLLVNAGIVAVAYAATYRDPSGVELLDAAGVTTVAYALP